METMGRDRESGIIWVVERSLENARAGWIRMRRLIAIMVERMPRTGMIVMLGERTLIDERLRDHTRWTDQCEPGKRNEDGSSQAGLIVIVAKQIRENAPGRLFKS